MLARILSLSTVACLLVAQEAAETLPSYSGEVNLPVALRTADGAVLEKGHFDIEVRFEDQQPVLAFSSGDNVEAVVIGQLWGDHDETPEFSNPLLGTIFMRSSADPIGTEEERHFSKMGLPQYQEEGRKWDNVIRVYELADSERKEVSFLFQQIGQAGSSRRTGFTLFLDDSAH
jgi:hypothetical protein